MMLKFEILLDTVSGFSCSSVSNSHLCKVSSKQASAMNGSIVQASLHLRPSQISRSGVAVLA